MESKEEKPDVAIFILIATLIFCICGMLVTQGCATVNGFGRDLQHLSKGAAESMTEER